eukprot:4974297-Amphidinium_carterae.1
MGNAPKKGRPKKAAPPRTSKVCAACNSDKGCPDGGNCHMYIPPEGRLQLWLLDGTLKQNMLNNRKEVIKTMILKHLPMNPSSRRTTLMQQA